MKTLIGITLACLIGIAVFGAAPIPAVDLHKEILALRADLNDTKRELAFVKQNLKHHTSPWQLGQHVQWQPNDPDAVTRMQIALGGNFLNHGGLLRVLTRDEGVVELQAGQFLTFEAPRWTPVRVAGRQ